TGVTGVAVVACFSRDADSGGRDDSYTCHSGGRSGGRRGVLRCGGDAVVVSRAPGGQRHGERDAGNQREGGPNHFSAFMTFATSLRAVLMSSREMASDARAGASSAWFASY